jgi:hypothetical protein
MRRIARGLALAVAATAVMTQLAVAAKPVHEKFLIDETFPEVLCGVDVTTHVVIRGNVHILPDGTFLETSRSEVTWMNAEGEWVVNFGAGQTRVTETLNADGTLTILETHNGIPERLRTSDGTSAAFDRGRITFEIIIDLGDPDDPSDDVLLSFETVFQAGPHPEADSDFALFCEVIEGTLG